MIISYHNVSLTQPLLPHTMTNQGIRTTNQYLFCPKEKRGARRMLNLSLTNAQTLEVKVTVHRITNQLRHAIMFTLKARMVLNAERT